MSAGGLQTGWVQKALDLWVGCHCCGSECLRCYARTLLIRKGRNPDLIVRGPVSDWLRVRTFKSGEWVMLCPSSDLFLSEAERWIPAVFDMISSRPDLVFIALTKRLENARHFLPSKPFPNLWLGTSAGTQESLDQRVPMLYKVPATRYIISAQPLLEPIDVRPYLRNPKLKLVVTGCEMGKDARFCDKSWLTDVRKQCRSGGVECFITRHREGTQLVNHRARDGRRSHNPLNTTY